MKMKILNLLEKKLSKKDFKRKEEIYKLVQTKSTSIKFSENGDIILDGVKLSKNLEEWIRFKFYIDVLANNYR